MNCIYKKIIEEICDELKINYKYISNNYIIVLEKNNKYVYLNEYKMGLNSQITSILCDDKYALYEVLKYHEIPVIEHYLIWNKENKKNEIEINNKLDILKKYFINNNNHIVLKPNMGYAGINVFNIENISDLESKFRFLLNNTDSIVINPFYNIKNEHRIIILNGNIRLMYTKNLKGNNWLFNLSKGSYVSKITNNDLKNKLSNLAIEVVKVLNAKFVSVDIIEDYNNNLYVLEVNSSVSMSKYVEQIKDDYNLVKDIYKDAIKLLFKKNLMEEKQ